MVQTIQNILYLLCLNIIFADQIQIIDGLTGKPIPNAHIIVVDNNTENIINTNEITKITKEQTVKITKDGYQTKIIKKPLPISVKLFPIIYEHPKIYILDTLRNPHYELKHPQKIIQIRKESIKSRNITNTFTELPGMIVKSYGGAGGVKTLSFNGSQGDRVQVLFNGIIINNEQSGNADISQIPVSLLKKIQFIPTGSSSRFGNSAMSGIININSGFNLDESLEIGFINNGLNVNYSNYFTKNTYLFGFNSGFYNEKQKIKWNESGDYNPVISSHKSYDWFRSELSQKYFSPWLNYKKKDLNISLTGLITDNNRIHSSKIFGPEYHPKINDNLTLLGINIKKSEYQFNISYKNQFINYSTVSPFTPPINAKHTIEKYKINNEILFNSISIFNSNIYTKSYSNSTNPSDTSSIQSHYGFTLRSFNDIFNTHITFRTMLEIKKSPIHSFEIIFSKHIYDYFLISTIFSNNFKKPNFNDLYWKPFGNKYLETEYSKNFYLKFEYDKNFFDISYITHVINYENMIIWLPKPGNQTYWSPENILSAISKGHSIKLNFTKLKNTHFKFSLSQNSTINKSTNNQLAYTPEWITNFKIKYKLSNFNLNLNYNHNSTRNTNYTTYNGQSLHKMPTYSIINTTIDYNFSISKYQTIIGFLVNNITDTRFQSVYGYPELGRSIEFQIKIKKRKKNEKIL